MCFHLFLFRDAFVFMILSFFILNDTQYGRLTSTLLRRSLFLSCILYILAFHTLGHQLFSVLIALPHCDLIYKMYVVYLMNFDEMFTRLCFENNFCMENLLFNKCT